jgi:NAD(P)H-dependent flavin oxidoreductase YrpB (nitropropane dioxygenase family)
MEGDVDYGCMSVGQGVGLIREILPVQEIVNRFVAGAQELLRRLSA